MLRCLASVLLALSLCVSVHWAVGPVGPSLEIAASEARLRSDLRFLTSPDCEGRAVGTKGLDLAAEYIAREFARAGLRTAPALKGWFQPFEVTLAGSRGPKQSLELRGPQGQTITLEHGVHFLTQFASTSGKVTDASMVFVGYGLSSKIPAYDDYAGVDVRGKVAVLIEGSPRDGEDFPSWYPLTERVLTAKKHGAIAVLAVNARSDGVDAIRDNFPFTTWAGQPGGLPTQRLRRDWLDRMLFATRGQTLATVEKEIDSAYTPRSGPLPGWTCRLSTDVTHQTKSTRNVVGVLEGSGPLAAETIVIGAHYDHVGLAAVPGAEAWREQTLLSPGRSGAGSVGGVGLPLLQYFGPALHPGADDNGSGTVAIMELARRFAAMKNRSGRRLVFVAFSGEEAGLLGSVHYCQHSPYPIDKTVTMLNLDMVGRLQEDRLLVSGVGSAKGFAELVDRHNERYGFRLTKWNEGDGPSDHDSFFNVRVPTLFAFTGFHEQYHRPTDRAGTINIPGLRRVASFMGDMAEEIAREKVRPRFERAKGTFDRTKVPWATAPATGIVSDFRSGVVLEGVVPGTPAEKAGLQKGDRILSAAGQPIRTAEDFLTLSRKWSPGERVNLRILRAGKESSLVLPLTRGTTGLEEFPVVLLGLEPDYSEQAAVVREVRKGGPADKAGLRAEDRIVTVDGNSAGSLKAFVAAVERVRVGQQVKLSVLRNGQPITATLTARAAPQVGFSVEQREGKEGVYLVDVDKRGAAARAGLAEGDQLVSLDGADIKDVDAFKSAVLSLEDTATVVVSVDGTRLQRKLRLSQSREKPLDARAVESVVAAVLRRFDTPGCVVAVVRDGEVLYLSGHGVRSLGADASPVTPDTLFALASISKPITVAGLGVLVDQGKMKWDDPVRKHLPGVRMRDALTDRELTIRDLLSHRTGVVRHDILWLIHDWSRNEMIRRACQLKADKTFRSEFGYNNLQYLMAGEAAAKTAQTSWENWIRKEVCDPLGMKSTRFSTRDLAKVSDWAKPHRPKNGQDGPVEVIEPRNIDNVGPAGALHATGREMIAWMRMQIDEGAFEGRRLLKPATVRAMHAPVVPVPNVDGLPNPFAEVTVQRTYAMGWLVRDYRGRRMLQHAGSLDGYRSLHVLLPEERIGIFVASNRDSEPVPEAITYAVADMLLGAEKQDWSARFDEAQRAFQTASDKAEQSLVKQRKKDTRPSLPAVSYAGTYDEPAHGTITIAQDQGKLSARWGKHRFEMEHWHHDVWRLSQLPGAIGALGDRLLAFRLDKRGEVVGFEFLGQEFRKEGHAKE